MRDLAYLALLVFISLAAVAMYALATWNVRSHRKALRTATWSVHEWSERGLTYVTVRQITNHGEVLDERQVGSIRDDDGNYDDQLLTLRAMAQQRLAVVQTR